MTNRRNAIDRSRRSAAPSTGFLESPWSTMALRPPLSLAEITPTSAHEISLVASWMSEPHVKLLMEKDWGVEGWHEEILEQHRDLKTRSYIASHQGREGGYLELYRVGLDVVSDYYENSDADIGMHGCLGPIEYLRQGYAFRFWIAIVDGILATYPECTGVVSDPAANNLAVRALEDHLCGVADGEFLGEVELPHKRAALYRFERERFEAAIDRLGGVNEVLARLES